ncbi:MAG: CoA transferase [Gammaproteobacteria bacterium]|nr:CoA transferase [Gammaproteobacteria bacterium]
MPTRGEALQQTRVVDLSDDKSIYGVKLLADMGADVIRPEPEAGDLLRHRGPFDEESGESLWYSFFASSRRHFTVDEASSASLYELNALLGCADLCFLGNENTLAERVNVEAAQTRNPKLVVIDVTPFGSSGPWRDFKAPDLVASALGGSSGITGDDYTPPLKLFGELNFTISGAYAATAALAGLYHAHQTGEGQRIEVPVHECIASSLEHVFMWYYYHEHFPNARAQALERRGSLHWTNLYVVMPTKNGAMMVTPTPNIEAQLAWLIEEDAFQDLLDSKFEEPENRRHYFERMMDVIREWVATEDTEELFYKAQERHAPYGWVQTVSQVASNPQLEARSWWQTAKVADRKVPGPGIPFHFKDTPGRIADSEWLEMDANSVLDAVGWEK